MIEPEFGVICYECRMPLVAKESDQSESLEETDLLSFCPSCQKTVHIRELVCPVCHSKGRFYSDSSGTTNDGRVRLELNCGGKFVRFEKEGTERHEYDLEHH